MKTCYMPEGTNIDGSLNYSITANYGSITVLWHVSVNGWCIVF